MFNILSSVFGRSESRIVESTKHETADSIRPLSSEEAKLVSGGAGGLVNPGQPVAGGFRPRGPLNPTQW